MGLEKDPAWLRVLRGPPGALREACGQARWPWSAGAARQIGGSKGRLRGHEGEPWHTDSGGLAVRAGAGVQKGPGKGGAEGPTELSDPREAAMWGLHSRALPSTEHGLPEIREKGERDMGPE